jgi:stage III sporulation protein AA
MDMKFLFSCLPEHLREALRTLPWDRVYEIRLRANSPIIVCISGRSFYVTSQGAVQSLQGAAGEIIAVTRTDLDTIIHKASNYSIYAVNEQIKQGFITIHGGIRIGICGEIVSENGKISTIKNVSSLNIRIPHQIRGCSYQVLPFVFGNGKPLKTLIISPPGAGKTTFLRDLACQVSDKYHLLNTLVLDERGEIAASHLGENQLDVGAGTDVITGCTKLYGFDNGIRSMRPDVIITDEVATREDIEMVRLAARSGVCIFASVHASGIDEIRMKPNFADILAERVFDRYVVLAVKDSAGVVMGVYDANLKLLAM